MKTVEINLSPLEAQRLVEYINKYPNTHIKLIQQTPDAWGEYIFVRADGHNTLEITDEKSF